MVSKKRMPETRDEANNRCRDIEEIQEMQESYITQIKEI
jgi:hypothetical protein